MHQSTLIIMTAITAAILATLAFAFTLPNQAFAFAFLPPEVNSLHSVLPPEVNSGRLGTHPMLEAQLGKV